MIKKPTAGPCEISTGVDYSGLAPVVRVCGKPGRLVKAGLLPFGIIICPDCRARREATDDQETD